MQEPSQGHCMACEPHCCACHHAEVSCHCSQVLRCVWPRNSISEQCILCRYTALGSIINLGIQGVAVATVLNKAGSYISPYNCPFPFHQDELPPSISSTLWNTLNFNATGAQCNLHHLQNMLTGWRRCEILLVSHCSGNVSVRFTSTSVRACVTTYLTTVIEIS